MNYNRVCVFLCRCRQHIPVGIVVLDQPGRQPVLEHSRRVRVALDGPPPPPPSGSEHRRQSPHRRLAAPGQLLALRVTLTDGRALGRPIVVRFRRGPTTGTVQTHRMNGTTELG